MSHIFRRDDASAQPERQSSAIYEIIKYTIISLIIVAPFRIFIAQPFIVSGESMIHTLEPKEYLIVDQLTYRRHAPKRGDVVIFKYPLDTSVYFVKRVIGLPGETVRIDHGIVSIGQSGGQFVRLDEPYVSSIAEVSPPTEITLEGDEYFMLGDNRRESSDSRVWGPLQQKFIVGRAFASVFPIDRMALFPGEHRF